MTKKMFAPRLFGTLLALAPCILLPESNAWAEALCCTIVSIDKTTGVVTLRDFKTGKIEKVTVKDPKKLATLAVGQPASADLGVQPVPAPVVKPAPAQAATPTVKPTTGAQIASPPSKQTTNAATAAGSGGGITVVSASYGLNVDSRTAAGNVTGDIAQTCNGQLNCEYRVDFHRIGDPFPGRQKTYTVTYSCADGQQRQASAPAEAGLGSIVSLSCPAAGGRGVINVTSASYGMNVNPATATNNATGDIAQQCNGQTNCSYRVDYHRIGDPFPGRQKTYSVTYNCGDGQQREASAPAEAGFGSVVALHCP
jgi:hypothetical protein